METMPALTMVSRRRSSHQWRIAGNVQRSVRKKNSNKVEVKED